MNEMNWAYPGFCRGKRLGVFLLPLDKMIVHHRVPPAFNSPILIYTPEWREALWEGMYLNPKQQNKTKQPKRNQWHYQDDWNKTYETTEMAETSEKKKKKKK